MHPVNRLLRHFGVRLGRTGPEAGGAPAAFIREYRRQLERLRAEPREREILEEFHFDAGEHPIDNAHFEFAFASSHIHRIAPADILDVGSGRYFILGLLARYRVTSVDVRTRPGATPNETVVTCDSKKLSLPDNRFDCVMSLGSLEHFGLGRYGDEFDPDADRKALREMVRVLAPGGHLILSTTLTRGRPSIVFNAHRIYDHGVLRQMCSGLSAVEEKYYSHRLGGFCAHDEITDKPGVWDVYCGCWKKPLQA